MNRPEIVAEIQRLEAKWDGRWRHYSWSNQTGRETVAREAWLDLKELRESLPAAERREIDIEETK